MIDDMQQNPIVFRTRPKTPTVTSELYVSPTVRDRFVALYEPRPMPTPPRRPRATL